jgi:serine protease Do
VPEEILPNRIGLSVRALEPEEKTFLAINQGVMVVAALGAAAEAGIQEGDVIITLDNVEIGTVDELNRVVQELPANKAIPILVARGEAQTFFTLRIVE